MKELTIGTSSVPSSRITVSENVNALTERVNNLQRRYYRSLAPDCEVRTASDKWYLRAIFSLCAGFVFPPLLAVAGLCVYKAKKGGEA